jgi:anti-anti-sigma factor
VGTIGHPLEIGTVADHSLIDVKLSERQSDRLVVGGCVFYDSAGISAMARLMRGTRDEGGQMVLARSRPSVARTLELAGLSELIPTYPTMPDALAALSAGTA